MSISRKMLSRRVTAEMEQEILRLFRNGLSTRSIAKVLGEVSHTTVRRVLMAMLGADRDWRKQ